MYEFKLMRLLIVLGIVGGMIGYFFGRLEWGIVIGLAIGSVYMAIKTTKKLGDEE